MTDTGAPSLSALLTSRKQDLIERWSAAVVRENTAGPLPRAVLIDHMPQFVDELIGTLQPEALPLAIGGRTAVEHGAQRLELGFNVAEVVREYGVLHRCIIALADEAAYTIDSREQAILAQDLNAGIASAVTQYVNERDAELRRQMSEHLGFIAHEVRNPLGSARTAFNLLKKKELAAGGRAVELLGRTLKRTNDVIDNALNHASLSLGVTPRLERVRIGDLLKELIADFSIEAESKDLHIVTTAGEELEVQGDRRLLQSAVSNLLQNALKFSRPRSTIHVRAGRQGDDVWVEVEDACGGLPPGRAEDLFKPLVRRGPDQTGFGLGLAIVHQAANAHNGALSVRDMPGRGCVFRFDVPARPGAPLTR
jgi:signal transduction histidine kinase